jgi:hypothetical protein
VDAVRQDFPVDITNALEAIISLKTDVADAHDVLLTAKIS